MVILLVVSLFIGVILFDMWRAHRQAPEPEMAIRADRFPLPGQGIFLTENHLTGVLTGNGMIWMEPDSFARVAAGPDARIKVGVAAETVQAGDPLFTFQAGGRRGAIGAPFNGTIVGKTEDGVLFKSDDLAADIRKMRVGECAAAWWDGERRRLGRFLAAIHGDELSLADGGDLIDGYLTHLPAEAFERHLDLFFRPVGARRAGNGRD
jgi:hypothetical protein